VLVAVFLGLILSAGEIIREKNILEKEEYLEFSRFSYLNSKIVYLLPVIALQTLLYVLTGNMILGLKELFWTYWMVLFSCAAFGVLLGLALSASVRNTDVLFKRMVPFVMILQLILGGGLIPFDHLNLGTGKYTPVLGDLMVSRWGYEAIAVEQFTKNKYEKLLYETDRKISQAAFYSQEVVPALGKSLILIQGTNDKDSIAYHTELLQNELGKITVAGIFPFEYAGSLKELKSNENLFQETSDYITYLGIQFYDHHENLLRKRDRLLDSLNITMGNKEVATLRSDYSNNELEKVVRNSDTRYAYLIADKEIIRNKDNIFQEPESNFGRARLFTPVKLLNGQKTETLWFNLSIIWLFSAICYLLVLFDAGRLINRFRLL
jgi:ABC-type multidrug transport system permease subunit